MKDEGVCFDNINHHFLNRCFAFGAMNYIRNFTSSFFSYFSPSITASMIPIMITVIPFIFERSSKQTYDKTLRLYNVVRFTLLGFYHRLTYGYSVASVLKYLINQPAPCKCAAASSPYSLNQPYQYSFMVTVLAMTIFDFSKYAPLPIYLISGMVLFLPNIFYILSGWASIGQVLGTVFLAAALHIYSRKTSNRAMFIESCFLFTVNLIFLVYYVVAGDIYDVRDSPVVTLFRGLLVLAYDIFLVLKFVIRNQWAYFTVEKGMILVETESTALRSTLFGTDEDITNFQQVMNTDKRDGLIAFITLILLKTVEYTLRDIKSSG